VEIQHALGADLFFAFDEFKSPAAPYEDQVESMRRTSRWAERSLRAHRQNLVAGKQQAILGIIQGGRHEELRRESAREIGAMGFDGFGIGGTFTKNDLGPALRAAVEELPDELPRHLLGIGEPLDVLEGIAEGMDLFDCVAATRRGRHGTIYTRRGIIHLGGGAYREDHGPLDPETVVPGTETFSRAYVSHLIHGGEMIGSTIASMHNLGFILRLVDDARTALEEGRFEEYREEFTRDYTSRVHP
jgi:queuine tRNA-ribosyltransferase